MIPSPAPRSRRLRSASGFTLIEIMISAAILLVAVIGFYGVFGSANQLAYASRLNTSARVQLESALASALTEPWRSEQEAMTPSTVPTVLKPTTGWENFLLAGESELALGPGDPLTNVTLLTDVRRNTSNPSAPISVMRGLLQRNVTVDASFPTSRRVSFRLIYGGPLAPLGLRTAQPVTMTVHTFRSRDN